MSKIQDLKGYTKFPSGFKVLSSKAIDARFIAEDTEFLNSIKEVGATYPGLRVFVVSEKKFYTYLPDQSGEYDFREDSVKLTDEQLEAINSTITKAKVLTYDELVASAIRSVTEGSIDGTIKVNGKDIPVHGLKGLAFKEELTKADLGLDKVNNVSISEDQVSQIGLNQAAISRVESESKSRDSKLTSDIQGIDNKISHSASSENPVPSTEEVTGWIRTSQGGRQLSSNSEGAPFPTKQSLTNGPYYYGATQTTARLNDRATVKADETQEGRQVLYTYDGIGWVVYALLNQDLTESQQKALDSGITREKVANYNDHVVSKNNPHGITKEQIGLDKVNNVAITEPQVTQIGLNQAEIAGIKTKDSEQDIAIQAVETKAQQALDTANGKSKNYAFDSYEAMVSALKEATNTKYKIGDNLLLKTKNEPDWWISGILETNIGAYGYYEISELEGKFEVDLSGYETHQEAEALKTDLEGKISAVDLKAQQAQSDASAVNTLLTGHTDNKSNPHGVTKDQVGLGNVDNTSDMAKPVSSATEIELKKKQSKIPGNAEAAKYLLQPPTEDGGNPGLFDKSELATAEQLNGVKQALGNKVEKEDGKGLSTNDFTEAYKTKLDGIAPGAQVNVIEKIKLNGEELSPVEKLIDLGSHYTNTEIDGKLNGKVSTTTYEAKVTELEQADSALGTRIDNEKTRAEGAESQLSTRLSTIEGKIPNSASSTNQLADKDFVNSSIATNTATFRGTFELSETEFKALGWQTSNPEGPNYVDNNDYAYLLEKQTGNPIVSYRRYKYSTAIEDGHTMGWAFEYALNNSGFTPDQLAALNSGITKAGVAKYDGYETSKQAKLDEGQLAAVNSGIDSDKVAQIEANKTAIANLSKGKSYLTVPAKHPYLQSGSWTALQANSVVDEISYTIPLGESKIIPKVEVFSYKKTSEGYNLEEAQGGIEINDNNITITCEAGYDDGYIWAIKVWTA